MGFPLVGIIHARDRHPAAKRLGDLQDPESAALVLCDEHLPLDEALEREWDQDSHLILYRVDADRQGEEYAFARVAKRSPFVQQLEQADGRIRVPILVFDHDLPKREDGSKQRWTDELLEEFLDALGHMPNVPRPTFFYTTLHGSRFIFVLQEEVSQLEAEQIVRGMIDDFHLAGVEFDDACQDWTRLFRLPKTVRSDTGQPFHQDPHFLLIGDGPTYRPEDLPHHLASLVERFAEVVPYEGDGAPDPEQVRELLTKAGANGRTYDSDWVREAKRYLQGRDAYDVIFEDAPLCKGEQQWNNQVIKIVGQVVGMLARLDDASPEGIFALLHSAIEQLQARENRGANETDWAAKTWDLVCRMWANEEAQIIAEQQERERKVAEAREHRGTLLEQVREARPEDVPQDEEAAQEWFQRRMIASDGRRHHLMRRDGTYNIRSVSDSMLIPMIRDLDMEEIIPTTEVRGKSIAQRSATALLNDHATPITSIICSSSEPVAYIDGEAGQKILHIPVHRLNSKLAPGGHFDERVDGWLRALGGDKYDRLVEWLAHSLEVKRAICALNLFGAPGTGKGMLAAGLCECFEGEQRNDGRALGKYNLGLLDSPVVNCDEGVPKISSDEALTVDQAFRSLVTGGRMTIRAMHRDPFTADIYPRILFTSNDRDIIRSIVGHRDLTEDDIRAIELRLLSIEVSGAAQALLTRYGNYAYTSGWVSGQRRSQYTLANHIYYLYTNRKPSQVGSGRLLVEGETSTDLVREMRLRSRGAQTVLRSLVKMIESPQERKGMHVHDSRVWVTPAGVVEFSESAIVHTGDDLSLPVAGRVLRQFARMDLQETKLERITPPGAAREQRGRWIELDLLVLFEEGLRYGLNMTRIERYLRDQPGGLDKIALALANVQQGADE